MTCGLDPHPFRAIRQNARGPRAGGLVVVLGGLRVRRERRPIVATTFYDPVAGGAGQLNVVGMVEPSALAGNIASDAHSRVAEAVS